MLSVTEIKHRLSHYHFDISKLPDDASPLFFQEIEKMFERRYKISTLNKIQTQTLSIPAPIDYLWQKIWYDDLTSPHE